MENQENTNSIQFIELKISNCELSKLVENEIFHEFTHKIQIDDSTNSKITIYYQPNQISKLVDFISQVNLFTK